MSAILTSHEALELGPGHLLAENDRAIGRRTVQMAVVLCNIDPDNRILSHECPLPFP